MQAITSTRPGGYIGYVGVPHGVSLDGEQLFFSHIHLHGGPAPVRRYLPELIKLVLNGKINPGKVFGYQSSCQHRELVGGAQAPLLRVPLADGTLVATSDVPSEDLIPSLLTLSDVMGTGWFAADAANVKPGSTVVVVGDGAVGFAWRALREANGCEANHRDEPSRVSPEARTRIWCYRHCH